MACILLLWGIGAIGLQVMERTPRTPAAARERFIAERKADTDGELESLTVRHPWAGTYHRGDGFMGSNLSIAPSGAYHESYYSCTAWGNSRAGTLVWLGNALRERRPLQRLFERTPPLVLQRVRWGERTYLIASEEMRAFVNAINTGSEPRFASDFGGGFYFLRRGDELLPADGVPELPAEYARLLLAGPIDARVLDPGRWRVAGGDLLGGPAYERTITLDAGSRAGVWPGMEFEAQEEGAWTRAEVTRVFPGRSEAKVLGWGRTLKEARIRPGRSFSTRSRWKRGDASGRAPNRSEVRKVSGEFAPYRGKYMARPESAHRFGAGAREHGVEVVRVAEIVEHASREGGLFSAASDYESWSDRMDGNFRRLGANAFARGEVKKEHAGQAVRETRVSAGFRVSVAGHPVDEIFLPEPGQPERWGEIRLKALLKQNHYARAEKALADEFRAAELSLSPQEFARWPSLPLERMNPRQREALKIHCGVTETRGSLATALKGKKRAAIPTAPADKARFEGRLAELRRSLKPHYEEYLRLVKEYEQRQGSSGR